MTSLGGLVLVAYCFKFAKMAGINQGCLPCIFSMTIFYVSILFWFKFNEKISVITIIGTVMMIPCIVFLAFGADTSASVTEEDEVDPETYTASQK